MGSDGRRDVLYPQPQDPGQVGLHRTAHGGGHLILPHRTQMKHSQTCRWMTGEREEQQPKCIDNRLIFCKGDNGNKY